MAFERLDSVVKRVVSRIANEVGEGDGCNRPDACKLAKSRGKEAGTDKAPASQEVVSTRRGKLKTASVTTQPGKAPASSAHGRGRPTQNPSALPPRRVGRPMLYVIEGGGRPAQGGDCRAAYAQARGGNPASNLKLVSAHAAPRSMID